MYIINNMGIFWNGLFLVALAVNVSALGLYPSKKTSWAKQITPDMYVAGRLTESQVKYASEDGFKSIIAISTSLTRDTIGEEILPDSAQLEDLATNQCGMFFAKIMDLGEDKVSMESVKKFTSVLSVAPPPYLITCHSVVNSAFTVLAYLANQTKHNSSFTPRMDRDRLFRTASSLGVTFNSREMYEIVNVITGEVTSSNLGKPDIALNTEEEAFWLLKRVNTKVFVSGQIRSNYLEMLEKTKIKYVINVRIGVTSRPNEEPSQEEVTLLNIHDNTGTYKEPGRQSRERLLQTRIDPDKPNGYINQTSVVNYASKNHLEYGDSIGYNETMMRLDFQRRLPEVIYIHSPMGGQYKPTSTEMWAAYKDIWMDVVKTNQSVLFTCTVGYRAMIAALLTIGTIEKRNSTWALEHARERGYVFGLTMDNRAAKLFQNILDETDKSKSTGHGNSQFTWSKCAVLIWCFSLAAVLYI